MEGACKEVLTVLGQKVLSEEPPSFNRGKLDGIPFSHGRETDLYWPAEEGPIFKVG